MIRFDLNEYDIGVNEFIILLNRVIQNDFIVNGYMIDWEYTVNDKVIELSASIMKR